MDYIKAVEAKLKKQGFSEEEVAKKLKKIMNAEVEEELVVEEDNLSEKLTTKKK